MTASAPVEVDEEFAAADRLTDLLDDAEDLFAARFRVRGEVKIGGACNQLGLLVFGRYDGESGLWYINPSDQRTPIIKAPIHVRSTAAYMLDDLWTECERAEDRTIRDAKAAVVEIEAFLARRRAP